MKSFLRCLGTRLDGHVINCQNFNAGWACATICSVFTQCAMKSFTRMFAKRLNRFSVCSARACYNFQKVPKKAKLKMQFSTINKWNFKKSSRITSNRTTVNMLQNNFRYLATKELVLHMLSRRENVQTSKFWKKVKEKNLNFFEYLQMSYKVLI